MTPLPKRPKLTPQKETNIDVKDNVIPLPYEDQPTTPTKTNESVDNKDNASAFTPVKIPTPSPAKQDESSINQTDNQNIKRPHPILPLVNPQDSTNDKVNISLLVQPNVIQTSENQLFSQSLTSLLTTGISPIPQSLVNALQEYGEKGELDLSKYIINY